MVEWSLEEGTVCSASDVALTSEYSWEKFRASRDDTIVRFVDFFQSKPLLYDSLTSTQKTDLQEYRQALLDLPATVLTQVGADFVLISTEQYFPTQPDWFADKHPMGQIHD
jgi:hypothetical protein